MGMFYFGSQAPAWGREEKFAFHGSRRLQPAPARCSWPIWATAENENLMQGRFENRPYNLQLYLKPVSISLQLNKQESLLKAKS
jgi:hypothetical protein